jgi:hypothetical protein
MKAQNIFLIVLFAGLLFTSCSKDEVVSPVEVEALGVPKNGSAIDFVGDFTPCENDTTFWGDVYTDIALDIEDIRHTGNPFVEGELEITTTAYINLLVEDPKAQIRFDGVQKSVPPVLFVTLQYCGINPDLGGYIYSQYVDIQPLIDSLGYTNDELLININGLEFYLQDAQPIQQAPQVK